MPERFTLADKFAANMRVNLVAPMAPGVIGIAGIIGIAGTLLFGWGMTICVFLMQTSTPVGIYNAVKPLLDEQKHSPTSIALTQCNTYDASGRSPQASTSPTVE